MTCIGMSGDACDYVLQKMYKYSSVHKDNPLDKEENTMLDILGTLYYYDVIGVIQEWNA